MERQLDIQLEKLKTRIIKMCSLVDEQVEFAIRSIEEENTELAQLVIERDKKVDKFDVKIDKICQKIFALNQPVAMDLRLIMSAMTINTVILNELEIYRLILQMRLYYCRRSHLFLIRLFLKKWLY
jgi:phosphate transport system protein